MHDLLQAFFSLFGKKAIGQVVGATAIGAIMVGLHFLQAGERPSAGEFSAWLIRGAATGFTAGLILVSPQVFFGIPFGLLGLAIAIVPMSHADGTSAPLSVHAVKVGVGAAFMLLSVILVAAQLRKMRMDENCEPHGPATGASRFAQGPIERHRRRAPVADLFVSTNMKISYHALELVKASESVVAGAAKAWWQANGYTLRSNGGPTHFSVVRGSPIGITDRQTQRIMEVVLKPVSDGTAVSVYHHTGRILCVVGVMFTGILQSETDSFLRYVRENATTKC